LPLLGLGKYFMNSYLQALFVCLIVAIKGSPRTRYMADRPYVIIIHSLRVRWRTAIVPLQKMDHTKILSAEVLIPTYLLYQMNRFVSAGY